MLKGLFTCGEINDCSYHAADIQLSRMKFIYVSKKVDDRIEALKKTGKTGKNLADKARMVIDGLTLGTTQYPKDISVTFTKYGEKRIKNCHKYDLGCGYRLIVVQRGEAVFIPFLGTHDNCHRWLETNSQLRNFVIGAARKISISDKKLGNAGYKEREREDKITDDDLFRHLTDKELRLVFSGLIQGIKQRSQSSSK